MYILPSRNLFFSDWVAMLQLVNFHPSVPRTHCYDQRIPLTVFPGFLVMPDASRVYVRGVGSMTWVFRPALLGVCGV